MTLTLPKSGIAGVHGRHGQTRGECLANAEAIIGEWLEKANEIGRAIPKPKGRSVFA